ncbi:MAG: winged helix-turn-helix transcriptional regulator [Thermoplasmataceae archaeon]
MKISLLEGQKGILRLLMFLDERGELNVQRIIDESELYDRIIKNSARALEKGGLIAQHVDSSSYPPKNMLSLTEKGHKVAAKLKEIEEILENSC